MIMDRWLTCEQCKSPTLSRGSSLMRSYDFCLVISGPLRTFGYVLPCCTFGGSTVAMLNMVEVQEKQDIAKQSPE